MINTKDELFTILKEHHSRLFELGVNRLGVFGSFVRDNANAESDIDLIVEFREGKKSLRNLVELGDYLELISGRKVELVTLASLSPFIGLKILSSTEYVSIAA